MSGFFWAWPKRNSLQKIFISLALGGILLSSHAASAQTIQNPGFENGTTSPWMGGGAIYGVNSANPHTGSYNAFNNGGWNSIFQNVSGFLPNTQYTLTAWGRLNGSTSSHYFFVSNDGGATKIKAIINSTTYKQYSITFTTGSNTSVIIGQEEGIGGNVSAYIDDFALVQGNGGTNPTPTPTATPTPTPTSPPPGGSGSITREVWNNVSGTSLSSSLFSTTPSSSGTISSFEAPTDVADNYAQRVRGYVTAPSTGSYTFWIAGDDNVELYLSSNNQPGSKTRIAYHTGWTNSREWNKYTTQKSAGISLQAGQQYYIEALMKEGAGGDNLAVGWSKPGQSTTSPSEVIPGSVLSPLIGGPDPTPTPTATPTPTPPVVSSYVVTKIRFYPRSGEADRMVNGRFSGSNTSSTNNFTALYTLTSVPADNTWTEINLSNSTAYRYIKYEAPTGSWGNIAEVEFYNGSTRLSGVKFGTAGSWGDSGNTFDKALDGNINTFFDAASANDQYVGLDLGASSQVGTPTFSPSPGTYSSGQNVVIGTSTSGATIRYTTNGTTPTRTTGTIGSNVTISANTTIRAIAYKEGLADSILAVGVYNIGSTPPPPTSTVSRVYHFGNSLTDTVNFHAFRTLAQSKGNVYNFNRHMIPGAPLSILWDNPNGFNESPYGQYPNALPNYTWDAITFQPFDRQVPDDTFYIKSFIDLARQRAENANTQFYIFSHWMRRSSDTAPLDYEAMWMRPYTGGWDGTNETKDFYEKLLVSVRQQTPYVNKPILIIPVGDVMREMNRRMKAGQVPGYTDIVQIYADGIHLNNVGALITAATFYATIYKTDPHGASYAAYDSISGSADRDITDALASTIYNVVWDVVKGHPYSGVS